LNLLPEGEASITPQGIRFQGLHYTCDLAIQQQWFTRYKGRKSQHVKLGVEPRLVDNIYLRLKRGNSPTMCHLTPADSIYNGRNWYEVLEEFALRRKANKEAETDFHQSKADFHAEMEQINSEARELTKLASASDKRSRAEKIRGIGLNRKNLKDHERKRGNRTAERSEDQIEHAAVIPINQANKAPAPMGYIPPAHPHSELREQRERAKKNEK
jgi:putative transposase